MVKTPNLRNKLKTNKSTNKSSKDLLSVKILPIPILKTQVDFGPRVPNTKAHKEAGKYLAEKLRNFDFEVIEQEGQVMAYTNEKLNIKNIIGAYKPELNNRILLYSHWDCRPFADQDDERKDEAILAANDGASGVGILLEIARQIQIVKPAIGIDIIFFDAEDYGENEGCFLLN